MSIVIQTIEFTYLVRDRYAIRPLIYSKNNYNVLISSENCAFDSDYEFNDVNAGEIIQINN